MKQTYLPDHFPQIKADHDQLHKRPPKDPEFFPKSLKHQNPSPIPPLQPIKSLSLTTQSLITTLDMPKKTTAKTSDEIFSSIKPSEKFEDLLNPLISLTFPYKYKKLIQIQEYLDSIINNARMRKLPIAFPNLKQAIESTFNTNIELEHVLRLNFLSENFYKLKWVVENGEESLWVDLPEPCNYSQFLLHNRNSVIRSELMKLVKKAHSDHLAVLGLKFDPEKSKTWHSSFDLHEVPEVPESPLPEKNPENPTVAKASLGKQLRACRLISLCKTLSAIFSQHRTSSLFLKSLIKKIQSFKNQSESLKHTENDIIEISELFRTWLTLFTTSSGTVVRLNKSIPMPVHYTRKIKQKYGLT